MVMIKGLVSYKWHVSDSELAIIVIENFQCLGLVWYIHAFARNRTLDLMEVEFLSILKPSEMHSSGHASCAIANAFWLLGDIQTRCRKYVLSSTYHRNGGAIQGNRYDLEHACLALCPVFIYPILSLLQICWFAPYMPSPGSYPTLRIKRWAPAWHPQRPQCQCYSPLRNRSISRCEGLGCPNSVKHSSWPQHAVAYSMGFAVLMLPLGLPLWRQSREVHTAVADQLSSGRGWWRWQAHTPRLQAGRTAEAR